jgi:hypothetical protein
MLTQAQWAAQLNQSCPHGIGPLTRNELRQLQSRNFLVLIDGVSSHLDGVFHYSRLIVQMTELAELLVRLEELRKQKMLWH